MQAYGSVVKWMYDQVLYPFHGTVKASELWDEWQVSELFKDKELEKIKMDEQAWMSFLPL